MREAIVREISSPSSDVISIERLASEILAHRPSETDSVMFDLLKEQTSPHAAERLIALLANLARRSPDWTRIVGRSLRKHGRCPHSARARLRAAIANSDWGGSELPQSFPSTTTPPRFITPPPPRPAGRATVKVTTSNSGLENYLDLVGQLSHLNPGADVTLDFTGNDHTYIVGLVVLAAWCRRNAKNVHLHGLSRETERYLDEIGFSHTVDGAQPTSRVVRTDEMHVGLATIGTAATEDLALSIAEICDRKGFIGASDRSALITALSELIENVQRHSFDTHESFVAAQYYPNRRKVTVAVSDTGIGIRGSFEQGRNMDARRRIRDGDSPLDLALSPLVTSKPITSNDEEYGHAGYGLYVVSELCFRNGGTFRISSGTESRTVFRRSGTRGAWKKLVPTSHAHWRGTIVALLLDLNNPVPISDVYRSLPQPKGFEDVDFFA